MANRLQIGGSHYAKHNIQPWDIIEEYKLDYWLGNVIKYVLRHQDKGGLEDLQKAQHYLQHAITRLGRAPLQEEDAFDPEEELLSGTTRDQLDAFKKAQENAREKARERAREKLR